MTIDQGIFIRNIFYMLSYAFQELRRNNYADIAGEDFNNVHDLFAEILVHSVSFQLKQGLHKEYIERHDVLSSMRGKLDMQATIRERLSRRMTLGCEYDELSVDNLYNQIVKSSILLLVKQKDVKKERKVKLWRLLVFFNDVSEVDLRQVQWKNLRFDRNSCTYQTLCFICFFLVHDLLLTTESGNHHMPQFSDAHMCRLYEKFILEYFKRHHPELHPSAKQIDWNIKEEVSSTSMLPIMQSDIYLTNGEKVLIIDAKYYQRSMQTNFNKTSIHSNNIYQIQSYVFHEDRLHTGKVDGMLLYAKTSEEIVPDGKMEWPDGNIISFKTLDLNMDFNGICEQLESIVTETFKSDNSIMSAMLNANLKVGTADEFTLEQ